MGRGTTVLAKPNRKQRKEMVVAEVSRLEEERYKKPCRSVDKEAGNLGGSCQLQNQFRRIPLVEDPTCKDHLPHTCYNTLPCPRHLQQWFRNEECCFVLL